MEYYVNEGNKIGGMEPQALGTAQTKITCSEDLVKGDLLEVDGAFSVGKAADNSAKVIGIAMFDYASGDEVVVETEGFFKMTSSAAITAGARLGSAGAGKVKTYVSGSDIGLALNTASGADETVYVKFTL